jgi:hypothetical protein
MTNVKAFSLFEDEMHSFHGTDAEVLFPRFDTDSNWRTKIRLSISFRKLSWDKADKIILHDEMIGVFVFMAASSPSRAQGLHPCTLITGRPDG